jgi:hypothetical protein
MAEFEKLLGEVHHIIYRINEDKVQTLQIKLNTLKEKIIFLRKYILKQDPYWTMQMM